MTLRTAGNVPSVLPYLADLGVVVAGTKVIRHEGGKYVIYSMTGKRLGSYPTRTEAEERLRQIEYFKRK
jgi:hypothetical protein